MATPQHGIFVEGTRVHRHLEFDLRADATPAALRAHLARSLGAIAGDVNVVVGFGPACWRLVAPTDVPDALSPFPAQTGMPATPRDVWCWVHGDDAGDVFDALRVLVEGCRGVLTLAHEVHGFCYHDERDLTGFIDGTENPDPNDAPGVAVLAAGPGAGGTFAITQRWVHRLADFETLSLHDQELVIGRTKADSVELDDLPATAHIARVVIEDDEGDELEIYRRSVPYGGATEHGLHFVGFCADPAPFEAMLRRMAGADDGTSDALLRFSTPVSGAAWFVPSTESLEAFGVPS